MSHEEVEGFYYNLMLFTNTTGGKKLSSYKDCCKSLSVSV